MQDIKMCKMKLNQNLEEHLYFKNVYSRKKRKVENKLFKLPTQKKKQKNKSANLSQRGKEGSSLQKEEQNSNKQKKILSI